MSPESRFDNAARLAIIAAVVVLLLLANLHLLSPEFDSSWRMVSEYATGQYGWVLSLMFISWALSSWALAFAIWPQVKTTAGRIGLFFLVAAGVGEAMATVFDITHPLHSLAALIGIPSLAISAMLISVSLGRVQAWHPAKKLLLWTANLTWISLALMVASFAILIFTYTRAGGDMSAGVITTLPPGVIAVVGWANRLLMLAYCACVITVAWQAIKLRVLKSRQRGPDHDEQSKIHDDGCLYRLLPKRGSGHS